MPRFLRTAYGVYALVIFLLTATITAGLLAVLPGEQRRRRAGQRAMRLALGLIGVRIRTSGVDALPRTPAVCVCNHSSQLDGLILFALLREQTSRAACIRLGAMAGAAAVILVEGSDLVWWMYPLAWKIWGVIYHFVMFVLGAVVLSYFLPVAAAEPAE